jgi:hypothetical protein
MTARQSRTERRAAERKARKIAQRTDAQVQPAASELPPAGPVANQHYSTGASARRAFSPELLDEFSPEFLAYATSIRHQEPSRPAHPSGAHQEQTPRFASQTASQPCHSTARAEINRANAQHSTGPRTSEGKLASSRNSLKHGLASAQLIIPGEDPAAFDALLSALLDEHQPANQTEEILVQEIAQSYWLTQRALRFQNQCFTAEGVDQKRLALFLRYQTTHERTFHKALNVLIQLKKCRAIGFVPQHAPRPKNMAGFVSQSAGNDAAGDQFVPQTAGVNGFVSQGSHLSR